MGSSHCAELIVSRRTDMCCGCVRRRPSLEPQESRKGLLYYHKDYLPYETFPGTSSASGAYWTNVQKTISSCNHNRCSLFLKPFTVAAETVSLSNLFHQLITRSLKKWFLESVLALFFFNFQVCPCVVSDMSYSKKLTTDTDENLCVILKTLIKSAHTRRSSSDQSFSLTNLPRMVMFQMWYHSGKPFLNFLNYCFIFDIVRWPVCITKFQMYFPWDLCQQIWSSYTSVHWATLHCSNDWLFANFELTPSCLEPTAWPATEGKRPKLKLLALPA